MKMYKIKTIIWLVLMGLGSRINAQSLPDYIQMAIDQAPEMQSVKYGVKKAGIIARDAKSYADTKITSGVFLLQPETRVGNQVFSVGVSQSFPWFGTLKSKEKWRQSQVKLQKYDTEIVKRNIAFQVKQLFYEMYELNAGVSILKDTKSILQSYEDMAMAALENNRASMNDVIKIRIQKNQLHARIYQYINDLEALQHNFNRLLSRKETLPVNLPAKLDVTDILVKQQTEIDNPVLQKIKQQKEVLSQRKNFVKNDAKPKITLGLNYIPVQARENFDYVNNGKDILMPQIGLRIPLFNKKYKSEIDQIQWQQKQVDADWQTQERNLKNQLEQLFAEIENQTVLVLATQKNAGETQRAINISMKAYETGMLDYDNILQLQLQKLDFQLKEIKAAKNAYLAKAKIEYITN